MVRWAEKSELPGLAAVEVAADGLFEQVGIVFPPGTTQIEEVSDPGVVLVEGTPPDGFALIGWVDGNLHLEQLAVRPDRMRQGIGGRLMAAVIDHAGAAGAPAVTLTTFRDVPWNAPWYERHGFTVMPEQEWGPQLRELVRRERELGIEVAPRVVMVRWREKGR
ncbi:probable acetyltransferase [[Actinomadura] parvosata subsp. kistnae]|uniref:GNAT family N-acetyltransferase n=1 Tax=[Actinomadura] parvosata subsp. kistnae TaxID=1909395 RepID=A0A1V0A6J5_9ACTN|nr:GNAT family N-acetyltransferase [Nonomuraea sp. ATCC 55076]AQZ65821.1 GNAT family N-acetyltransferase [Nonomuraea sp. ATCC 55076]SPL97247.1 probable acetyltransferase [Actinomadura parvosata subsp. kistnae]